MARYKSSKHSKIRFFGPLEFFVLGLMVLVLSVAGLYIYEKQSEFNDDLSSNESVESTETTTNTQTTVTPTPSSSTSSSNPQSSAIEFAKSYIQQVQAVNKNQANTMQSTFFTNTIKTATGDPSFANYCAQLSFCDSLKWVKFDSAKITSSAATSQSGVAVEKIAFAMTTVVDGATNVNTVILSISGTPGNYLVDYYDQTTSGGSN